MIYQKENLSVDNCQGINYKIVEKFNFSTIVATKSPNK